MPKKRSQGGVWCIDRPGRPNAFGVQWREKVDGVSAGGGVARKVRTEFFDTAEKREARAAALRRDKRLGSLQPATRSEVEEWREFKNRIGDTPWQTVVREWETYRAQNFITECTTTVDQAVDAELKRAAILANSNPPLMSRGTFQHKKRILELFAAGHGRLKIMQLTAEQIEAWIDGCDQVKAPASFNAYRKQVRSMLAHYVEKGDLRRNPAAAVKKRDASLGEVEFIAVDATARLFAYALQSERYKVCIGRLALEAFAGLRFSSACRIEKKDIVFEDGGINLPAHKLKTKRRHFIDDLPPQLWAWLKVTPETCWALTARQYLELKTDLFAAAGVAHPRNALRHNFATYHVAAFKNPGKTASILCHRNQQLLYAHYKGRATEAAGKSYQGLTPRTAVKLAASYVPQSAGELHAA